MRELPKGLEGHITKHRRSDVEGNNNRGFQVDLLEVYVDEYQAGYLSLMYVPKDRYRAEYSHGYYDYLRNFECHFEEMPREPDGETEAKFFGSNISSRTVRLTEPADPNNPFKDFLKRVEREKTQEWTDFKDFSVCRPKPDYISIYGEWDDQEKHWSAQRDEDGECQSQWLARTNGYNFKGLALGHLLYREGARWMAEKDLRLHSSSLIDPSATRAWQHLAKNLSSKAIELETRKNLLKSKSKDAVMMILNGREIDPWMPDWAQSLSLIENEEKKEILCKESGQNISSSVISI